MDLRSNDAVAKALIAFGAVVVVPLGLLGVFLVYGWSRAFLPGPTITPGYVRYDATNPNLSQASLAARDAYIRENPQPRNAIVLRGLSTQEISDYMVQQVSGGLKVDCTYCHGPVQNGRINFGAESLAENPAYANKVRGRNMMLMAADLNQNFVAKIPAKSPNNDYQVTCATCHNGQAAGFAYTQQYPLITTVPVDFRLPYNQPNVLRIQGRNDPNLFAAEYNQVTMYYMNHTLGVGCTFCHNANNFASNEVPQKGYATSMLQMVSHLKDNY
ncbi:MAG: photosynthetic reaction center cytochrome c subunit family protein, partial [Dehalococcoidia bacterium]|nr:photosynthetic reaction center cytochrome c subunit family protein [Dehalococcoidia bacterium]